MIFDALDALNAKPGVAIAYVPEVAGPQANDKYEVAMLPPSPSTNAASEDIHVVANDSESKQEFGTFDFEDFFVLPPDEVSHLSSS